MPRTAPSRHYRRADRKSQGQRGTRHQRPAQQKRRQGALEAERRG